MNWIGHAACKGIPADDVGLADCRRCEVRDDCLCDALEVESIGGEVNSSFTTRGGRKAVQRYRALSGCGFDPHAAFIRLVAERSEADRGDWARRMLARGA